MTVVRILIDLQLFNLTAGTGGILGMGIYMGELDAIAAGAAPDPLTADDHPGWMWRSQKSVVTSTVNDSSQSTLVKADLRGKRKYSGEDMDLTLVLQRDAPAVTINIDGLIRVLGMKS